MKQMEVLKRDNLIVDIIRSHIGEENAISCKEITKLLQENGYSTKNNTVHTIVSKIIRDRYLPICSLNGKGYYFPKNKQDIESAIAHLQSRVDEIQSRIGFLKQFLF